MYASSLSRGGAAGPLAVGLVLDGAPAVVARSPQRQQAPRRLLPALRARPLGDDLGRPFLHPLRVAAGDDRQRQRSHLPLDLLRILGEELADHVLAARRADQQLVGIEVDLERSRRQLHRLQVEREADLRLLLPHLCPPRRQPFPRLFFKDLPDLPNQTGHGDQLYNLNQNPALIYTPRRRWGPAIPRLAKSRSL